MHTRLHRLCFLSLLCTSVALGADKPIELADISGKTHLPLSAEGKKAVVLVFVSPFCPTSNAFTPEVNKLAAEYGDRFNFYLVEADTDIKLDDAKKHVETLEIKAPVLLDPQQQLVKLTGATTTPEVAVLATGGTSTFYQGRINDLYATQTRKLKEPKSHDLRDALEAIAAGRPVANPKTKAIGCSITVP